MKYLLFICLFTLSAKIQAAGCCGASGSIPTLITADNKAKFQIGGQNSAITHDVSPEGFAVARNQNYEQVRETIQLSASYLMSPLWQLGTQFSVIKQTIRSQGIEESTMGLGDPKMIIAYEFLPVYSYSPWKPRGFVFFEQSFSVSNSIYDNEKTYQSDALSAGFHNSAIGASFMKSLSSLQFSATFKTGKPWSRTFGENQAQKLSPGLQLTNQLNLGVNLFTNKLRIDFALLHYYQSKGQSEGSLQSVGLNQYYLENIIQVGYLLDQWNSNLSLTYNDQSFWGTAKNTALSKSVGLSFSKSLEL